MIDAGALAARDAGVVANASSTIAAATSRPPLFADAAAALELLGTGPLQPTGAVADALAAGRLIRTGSDEALDQLEAALRTGPIDLSTKRMVGEGMNGPLYRYQLHDDRLASAAPAWVVEKGAGAQATQEEFGWRVARELGIDHLVAAAMRRADGAVRIVYHEGSGVTVAGVTDVARLEQALAKSYLGDTTLALSPLEAAQAARIDRQLLQVFDYLLANNDRSGSNALFDAATKQFRYFDSGHAGRGQLPVNGGTTLEPALQLFQAGRDGGRIDLDPVVVDLLRRRLTPDRIDQLHADVFHAADMPGPPARSYGERFIGHASSDAYRTGITARLQHVLETGGYTHRGYTGDAAGELPPLVHDRPNVRGFRNVREQFARF